jgi:hypothetical protein
MSSIFDIVISFVAALIAAAFAHFGASEIPVGRNLPAAATPPEATSYVEPAPVTAPEPPAAPVEPQPISDIHVDQDDAEHAAAIAEQAEYEAEMIAHEAEMKAHEAQLKAFEDQIEASIEAVHRKAEARHLSNLSFRIDGKTVSGINVTLPQNFTPEHFNPEAFAVPPIDVASLEAAKSHAQPLERVAQAACKAAEAARVQQMMTQPAHPSGDVVL